MYIEARYPKQKAATAHTLSKDVYGSYAKGYANPDSDIDVAVILPGTEITDHWEQSADLWGDIRKVSVLIEPVLMEDNEDSMLYREVMRTGVTV